ncbi:MAG TPA: diguanylate cyclase response regulator, partial [Novosphingobium sp.]|nr:diguanylate cyclase response regulator [Novosphingobium sp.]
MSRFRMQDRNSEFARGGAGPQVVLLIEDSLAVCMLLKQQIEKNDAIRLIVSRTYAEAETKLAEMRPVLAISGL